MTILVEIRDNPEQVRKTIDKMCHGWQTALDRANAESATPSPLAVRRDDDGIWYLQLGLAGPAWTVTDRFIITCWSPAALRSYLEQMRDRVGRPMK